MVEGAGPRSSQRRRAWAWAWAAARAGCYELEQGRGDAQRAVRKAAERRARNATSTRLDEHVLGASQGQRADVRGHQQAQRCDPHPRDSHVRRSGEHRKLWRLRNDGTATKWRGMGCGERRRRTDDACVRVARLPFGRKRDAAMRSLAGFRLLTASRWQQHVPHATWPTLRLPCLPPCEQPRGVPSAWTSTQPGSTRGAG